MFAWLKRLLNSQTSIISSDDKESPNGGFVDVSVENFGRYQYCTIHNGKWYSDLDFDRTGRLKKGAVPRPEMKPRHEWPFCDPDPEGTIDSGLNRNGIEYRKEETSPGVWQYVVDKEAMQLFYRLEQQRENLWWALRSRVLTEEELTQARNYGSFLNVGTMQPHNALEKSIELNNAFARQAELRIFASRMEANSKS